MYSDQIKRESKRGKAKINKGDLHLKLKKKKEKEKTNKLKMLCLILKCRINEQLQELKRE